jgi:hypothetical protein
MMLEIPKGFGPPAQGCRVAATLGSRQSCHPTLTGLRRIPMAKKALESQNTQTYAAIALGRLRPPGILNQTT